MIDITRFNEMLLELKAYVNSKFDQSKLAYKNGYWVYDPSNAYKWILKDGEWADVNVWMDNARWIDRTGESTEEGTCEGRGINHILLSPTESHIIKKLSDRKGICLAVKMADSDSNIGSVDNYSEQNHQLFFILEKCGPGDFTDQTEREHYAKMQYITRLVKEYLLNHGLNGIDCGGDETLSKPFHTEWEYQIYGGFNGLSISCDIEDFRL